MKVTYRPFAENGETIEKYGYYFVDGQTRDIEEDMALKLLACPYFTDSIDVDGVEVLPASKPKRKRRTKAEIEAEEDGQDQI